MPDFSMPFNVMALTSTALTFFFGSIFRLTSTRVKGKWSQKEEKAKIKQEQQELKKARAHLGEDRLAIFKVDTEKYPKLATRHKVEGLPTMVLFKEGEEVGRFEGAMTAADLVQKLEYFLAV